MKIFPTRRAAITAAALFTTVVFLGGCAGSDNGGAGGSENQNDSMLATRAHIIDSRGDASDPVSGGTLTFAGYSMPASLDPAETQASGSTGGTEMASVYGLLMRYDPETDEFVPELAKSLEESDDHLTWTLNLRDEVKFSDGTTMDAQAVVDSIKRFNDEGGENGKLFEENVESVEASDSTTVVFNLNKPLNNLPALLTFGHGLIIAPAGYADPDNFQPIGAGPYTVQEFTGGVSLIVAARDDYWDGEPHLDSVKFVDVSGDQPKLDALNSGGIQMAYLRDADQIEVATDTYPGFIDPVSITRSLDINVREGRPASDPTIRQAIAYAVNPDLYVQRVNKGVGSPGKEVFQEWSKWHADVDPLPYDPDKAKQLLEEAKSDGFDGRLQYLSMASSVDTAVTFQSMLQDVGFEIEIDYAATVADLMTKRSVNHDFDLTVGASSISDAVPYMRLEAGLRSGSPNSPSGLGSDEMDQLLDAVQQATGDDAKSEALAKLQKQIYEELPFIALDAGADFVPWSGDVHGAVPSTDGIMLLDKAWISS